MTTAEKARRDRSTVGKKISTINNNEVFVYSLTVLAIYFMLCVQRTRMVCLCEGRVTKRFRMVFVYCLVSCFTGPGLQHAGLPYHHAFSPMLLFKGSSDQ